MITLELEFNFLHLEVVSAIYNPPECTFFDVEVRLDTLHFTLLTDLIIGTM